jgi:hypothetical protein
MIQLSPRSYVFNGLEIIREPLIRFIGKTLRKKDTNTWWYNYVYKKFKEKERIDRKYDHITRSGEVRDLFEQLDESLCFKVIEYNKKIFGESISKQIREVRDNRNICAHPYRRGGVIEKRFAYDALFKMALLMEYIGDKDCQKQILTFRSQMDTQFYSKKPVLASRESLVAFLKDNVWGKSFQIFDETQTIEKSLKDTLRESMINSIKYITEELKTADDIVNWFQYHLNSPEGITMYKILDGIEGVAIPTFEDVRLEFMQLCYGEEIMFSTDTEKSNEQ